MAVVIVIIGGSRIAVVAMVVDEVVRHLNIVMVRNRSRTQTKQLYQPRITTLQTSTIVEQMVN